MDIRVEITRLILVLFSLGTVLTENWTLLRSEDDEYIPSRALKWLPRNSTETFEEAVVGFSENLPVGINVDDEYFTDESEVESEVEELRFYICRIQVLKNGHWSQRVGTVRRSNQVCQIRTSTFSYFDAANYEVLHNERGAVHLKWKSVRLDVWPKIFLSNAVSVNHGNVIIRIPTDIVKNSNKSVPIGKTKWIAEMDSQSTAEWERVITENENLRKLKFVEVLVEIEPVFYEVNISEIASESDSYELNRTELKLGEITLRNTLHSSMKVESTIPFQWLYVSSWSSNETILHGINTTIRTNHFNVREKLGWSEEGVTQITRKEEIRYGLERVSAYLPANTAVQITLQAKLLDVEDTLVGSMSTFFEDGDEKLEEPRPISMVWRRTVLTDSETTYGPMFHLSNNATAAVITNSSSLVTSSRSLTTMSTDNFIALVNGSNSMASTSNISSPITTDSPISTITLTSSAPPTPSTTPSSPTTTVHPIQPITTTSSPPPTTVYPSSSTTAMTPTPPPTPTTEHPPSSTTTTTPSPSTTTVHPTSRPTTTPSNSINLDMTVFFKLKLKIPVK